LGFLAASARSLDQRLVCQPLPGDPVNKAVEPGQGMVLDVALIEPEGELVNIAAKVLRAGVVIDADQAAFQNRENAVFGRKWDQLTGALFF